MEYSAIEDVLTEKIAGACVQDIEDFLGYPISADVMENLEDRIRSVLDSLSEDELLAVEDKFWNPDDPDSWETWVPSTQRRI